MGAIGGMLGLSGGAGGTGFGGPNYAPLLAGTTGGQLAGSYTGTQNALGNQQALLNALAAQKGIQNQSQVYNQLQDVAAGTGPNPAQAMLANSTGQNVANQAALMASQRGAGANTGLIARQAAQQGAGIQQNAAGQAAAMQAQQSLNALGAAGSLANQQAAQQIGQQNAAVQGQMGEQQLLQNVNAQNNQANIASVGNVNNVNAGLAGQTMGMTGKIIGGAMGGAGAAAATLAEGGIAEPGAVISNGPKSFFGKQFAAMSQGGGVGQQLKSGGGVPGKAKVAGNSYSNDNVKALLSPGEGVIDRETMQDQGQAGQMARTLMAIVQAKKKSKP